ncbi:MAG: helix-turn-helix domain-containing protein [Candidatus Aminicenantes bacterium]|nr:helix-turn-helix domain-containing protein [Candidatus Aminicenantes bacterium]
MTSLGEDLKRERELRAVPLPEIAASTKVSLRLLEDLEAGRWARLPGPFFIKGIVRAYCRTIGADEDYFLNKYHHEVLVRQAAEAAESGNRAGRQIVDRPARRRRLSPRRAAVFLAVLAGAAAAAFFLFRPRRPELPVVPKPASFAVPEAAAPPVPEELAEAPAVRLRLDLEFSAETWMRVTADGQVVLEGIRRAGDVVRLEAEEVFVLHTGNAGGVGMKINGRPALPLGPSGAVRTDIRITPDNLSTFLRETDAAAAAPER